MQEDTSTLPSSWGGKAVGFPNLEGPDVHVQAHAGASEVRRAAWPAWERGRAPQWAGCATALAPKGLEASGGGSGMPRSRSSAHSLTCRCGAAQTRRPLPGLQPGPQQSRESSVPEPGWEATSCPRTGERMEKTWGLRAARCRSALEIRKGCQTP